jgi:hypothetical protein
MVAGAAMATLTLADEIFELHRKLLLDLPPGTAALTRHASNDPAGGEDIDVTPANPNSARISHHPLGDIIYSEIGRHTTAEFWVGSREREQQELEKVRRISRAVIDGGFSEDVWTVTGKIVKSRATIEVNGRIEGIGGFLTFFNPLRRKQKQHFEYAPYVSSEHGGSQKRFVAFSRFILIVPVRTSRI